jgi:hypothetical protein
MFSTGISMGSLAPGVPLIYERVDSTVYSRRVGETERTVVGYDHDPRTSDGRPVYDHIQEDKMWGEITVAACASFAMRSAG